MELLMLDWENYRLGYVDILLQTYADRFDMQYRTFRKCLDSMESKGILRTEKGPSDRSKTRVYLIHDNWYAQKYLGGPITAPEPLHTSHRKPHRKTKNNQ